MSVIALVGRAELTVVIRNFPCALGQREFSPMGLPERKIRVYELE